MSFSTFTKDQRMLHLWLETEPLTQLGLIQRTIVLSRDDESCFGIEVERDRVVLAESTDKGHRTPG